MALVAIGPHLSHTTGPMPAGLEVFCYGVLALVMIAVVAVIIGLIVVIKSEWKRK